MKAAQIPTRWGFGLSGSSIRRVQEQAITGPAAQFIRACEDENQGLRTVRSD